MKVLRPWLLVGAVLVLGIFTAWVARPPNLKQRLERAGVHFTEDDQASPEYNRQTQRIAYDINKNELAILLEGLKKDGFKVTNKTLPSYDLGIVSYSLLKPTTSYTFHANAKSLRIDVGPKKTIVYCDFPLDAD